MYLLKPSPAEILPSALATCSPYFTREKSFNLTTPPSSLPAALRVESIDPCRGDAWDRAVLEHPEATIFHSGAWAKVLVATYGHAPAYLKFSAAERLVALLPMMEVKSVVTGRRGVCLPFSDFCGPLLVAGETAASLLVKDLSTVARERHWKYFELRGALPAEMGAPASDKFYGHKLDLTKPPNELLEGFASAARRAIRKAQRSGIAVEVTTEAGALSEFYRLHNATRRRHGIPPQPFSFFRNIHEHVMRRGLGFIVIARLHSRPIAAAIFFHFNGHALFKFGASDERHQADRPNNLVMWEGIKHLAGLEAKTLHLGRTDLDHAGLRRFKQSFGTEEEVLSYVRFDTVKSRWMNEKSHKPSPAVGSVFRLLPLRLTQAVGTVLYPHLH